MRIIEFEGKFYVKDRVGFLSIEDNNTWATTEYVFKYCGHDTAELAKATIRRVKDLRAKTAEVADREKRFKRRVKRWWLK